MISCNKGGTYIICELNGSTFDRPITAFHMIPYFVHKSISIPDPSIFINISQEWLEALECSFSVDLESNLESVGDGQETESEVSGDGNESMSDTED